MCNKNDTKQELLTPNEKKSKRPTIPMNVIKTLWAKSAGRCEFEGCGKVLYEDGLTTQKANYAYVAHIVSWTPDGPRGNNEDSARLAQDETNLMLMCNEHHHLIDHEGLQYYTVERLRKMKENRENELKMLTGLNPSQKTICISYIAKIGDVMPTITNEEIAETVLSESRYPDQPTCINISGSDCYVKDHENLFWENEDKHLFRAFKDRVIDYKSTYGTNHMSLFALAPMPLLVRLGTLFNDIKNVDVYQCHREPKTWKWVSKDKSVDYRIVRPKNVNGKPIIVFALSSEAIKERVIKKYNEQKHSIWIVTVDNPENDIIKSKEDLQLFRMTVRKVFDEIHTVTNKTDLYVFMSIPSSCAIEIGRCWMPKADMNLHLYDYSSLTNEDVETIIIKRTTNE